MADMKFGVFDHWDASGAPLGEFHENRLRLMEAYGRIGILYADSNHSTEARALRRTPVV